MGGQLRDFRVPGCSAPPARFPTHPSCSRSGSGQGTLPASTSAAAHEAPSHWLGQPRVISVTAAAAVGASRTLGRGGGGGGDSGRHLRSSGLPAAAVPRSSRRAARRRRALVRFWSGSAVLGREAGLAGARAEGRCPGSGASEKRASRSPSPTPGPASLSPRPPPPGSSQPRDLLSLRSLQSGSPSLGSPQSRVPPPRVPFSHGSPGPGSPASFGPVPLPAPGPLGPGSPFRVSAGRTPRWAPLGPRSGFCGGKTPHRRLPARRRLGRTGSWARCVVVAPRGGCSPVRRVWASVPELVAGAPGSGPCFRSPLGLNNLARSRVERCTGPAAFVPGTRTVVQGRRVF